MNNSDFIPASRPVLWDLRSCDEWLARATLADASQACSALLSLLGELEDAPPRHLAYLQVLERLREPILIAQEENSRKFAAKSLPLGHAESVAFSQACNLWIGLLRAYRRILRAALKGSRPELGGSLALLCERAIECAGELISMHFLARREIGEDAWHWLHETYALALRRGLADTAVTEPGSRTPSCSSCTAAYVRPLMLALTHPYGLKERELTWTRRWTHRWAEKARVVANPGLESGGAYCIDLAGPDGPHWRVGRSDQTTGPASPTRPISEHVRHLDLADVAHSITWRLKKLEQGMTPGELGLGRDCIQPTAGELLRTLLSCWMRPPKSRQFPRRAAHATVELAGGMAHIHAALGGEAVAEDIRQWDYNRREAEQIHILRHAIDVEARRRTTASGIEHWDTLDESANGFRLQRKGPGERLAHRQLVALRPQGAHRFILCELRWLTEGADQTLTVGARALIGLAQPVSVRLLTGDAAKAPPFSHALVLPVAKNLPASIVLPSGWYQPARTLEMRARGRILRLRLTEILARGLDFDQARFDVLT